MNVNDLAYFVSLFEQEGLTVIEKPTIPKDVAKWIDDRRESGFSSCDITELILDIDRTDYLTVHTEDDSIKIYLLNRSSGRKEALLKAAFLNAYEVEELEE